MQEMCPVSETHNDLPPPDILIEVESVDAKNLSLSARYSWTFLTHERQRKNREGGDQSSAG